MISTNYQNEAFENGHLMIQKCVLLILDSRHMHIYEWSFQLDLFSLRLTAIKLRKYCFKIQIKSRMAHSGPPVFSDSPHHVASTLEYTSEYYKQHTLPSVAFQCTTEDLLLRLHRTKWTRKPLQLLGCHGLNSASNSTMQYHAVAHSLCTLSAPRPG